MNLDECIELLRTCPTANANTIDEKDVRKYLLEKYVITTYEADTIAHHLIRCFNDLSYLSQVKLKEK